MNNATKTIPHILRDNICTGFNALNLMIAVALAAVGAWKNLLFIFIILINTTVSIVQEIRAKRQIERLTLLAQPAVAVMRSGKEQRIRPEEIRKGDTPVLAAGDAVCTDCILQEGRPEVNEAIPSGSGCADGGFPDWTEPFESLPDRVSPRIHHDDQRMEADFLIRRAQAPGRRDLPAVHADLSARHGCSNCL